MVLGIFFSTLGREWEDWSRFWFMHLVRTACCHYGSRMLYFWHYTVWYFWHLNRLGYWDSFRWRKAVLFLGTTIKWVWLLCVGIFTRSSWSRRYLFMLCGSPKIRFYHPVNYHLQVYQRWRQIRLKKLHISIIKLNFCLFTIQ